MNREEYPGNWDALAEPPRRGIARSLKAETGYICQNCHRPCRWPNENREAFEARLRAEFPQWLSELYEELPVDPTPTLFDLGLEEAADSALKLQRFTATVAHINHDPWNPNAQLVMWCVPCHARYDLRQMGRKQILKRERLGQLRLQGV